MVQLSIFVVLGAFASPVVGSVASSSRSCTPVKRPVPPVPSTLPLAKRPHFVTILVDDMGFDDTQLHNNGSFFTPALGSLRGEGILLQRHHTFMWCSPTRRSFLSGRFPVHIGANNPQACSNDLPLEFTTLGEKLRAADYESHFVGKGHLGYQTMEHLPVNRGFDSHTGYLGGMESYVHGEDPHSKGPLNASKPSHDMWDGLLPGVDLVQDIWYSTNYFTSEAVRRIENRNISRPFWLHLCFQAVHAGRQPDPPPWEQIPSSPSIFRSQSYGSMLKVMDDGVRNVTAALKSSGLWENTLLLLSADNGGDCEKSSGDCEHSGNCQQASNWPLLGRKCTPWEGGTRTAAVVAGGIIPSHLRGTDSTVLIHIADWYRSNQLEPRSISLYLSPCNLQYQSIFYV
jgi:arylsulfatase A-like enzyme